MLYVVTDSVRDEINMREIPASSFRVLVLYPGFYGTGQGLNLPDPCINAFSLRVSSANHLG